MRLRSVGINCLFSQLLARMSVNNTMHGTLELPDYVMDSASMSVEELCERVFPAADMTHCHTADFQASDPDFFAGRAILSMRNSALVEFNDRITDSMRSQESMRYSADEALTDNVAEGVEEITREFLQSVDLPGLPPARLRLKVGMPIMLLRNLRATEGLCNGTRMQIVELCCYTIRARILTGDFRGSVHLIPRITLYSKPGDLHYVLS